ncbi:MAG TPA: hypothetical protein VNX61_07585 [Rhizomicrobium sp.]|nr:hypothetical protein [Rhizomicrobium sp.]
MKTPDRKSAWQEKDGAQNSDGRIGLFVGLGVQVKERLQQMFHVARLGGSVRIFVALAMHTSGRWRLAPDAKIPRRSGVKQLDAVNRRLADDRYDDESHRQQNSARRKSRGHRK